MSPLSRDFLHFFHNAESLEGEGDLMRIYSLKPFPLKDAYMLKLKKTAKATISHEHH